MFLWQMACRESDESERKLLAKLGPGLTTMQSPKRLRILTYNVHRCVGRDGRHSLARISRVIQHEAPSIVALQELDVNRARTQFVNQASLIASALDMKWIFFPAHARKDEHFGNAILSNLPMTLIRADLLPPLPNHPGRERRAAIWVGVEWNGWIINLVNTHLGLSGRERVLQADSLLGTDWLASPACAGPSILCGDFNAVPGSRAYRRIRRVLRDPFPWSSWPPGTFPSSYPLLRLDHVFFSADWKVHRIKVPRNPLTRVASDHLPLVVDASLSMS
jgi:endonuclease/exonuclease/phosphatase family metal-dependent hydrolase